MDWPALLLSLELALCTMLILLPVGVWIGRKLAWSQFRGKSLVEALLALPLVLPPTVLGFYLLVAMGASSPIGQAYQALFGSQLPGQGLTQTATGAGDDCVAKHVCCKPVNVLQLILACQGPQALW